MMQRGEGLTCIKTWMRVEEGGCRTPAASHRDGTPALNVLNMNEEGWVAIIGFV